MLTIENLSLRHNNTTILDNISHSYKAGTITAIIGNNGAGKTCLLQTIIGQIKPTTWSIQNNIWTISYCPDHIAWYKQLTPYEHAQSVNQDTKTIETWIEKLQLQKYQNTAYHKLSQGNKQKVNLLMSLLSESDLYIRDEPTQHLDPKTRYIIHEIMIDIQKRNKTMIYSTHFLEDIGSHTDYCMIIEQGKVKKIQTMEENLEQISNYFQSKEA